MSRRPLTTAEDAFLALPATAYLGSVNAWECDEMGHMNVRFWVAKWAEGLAHVAAAAGSPHAFTPRAASTLIPLDQHIRFLAEARPGAPLSARAAVTGLGTDWVEVYTEFTHADGRPAAGVTARLAHAEARTAKTFPWSAAALERWGALKGAAPAHGLPRSIDPSAEPGSASVARANAIGAPIVGRCMVRADEVDAFGRMRPELFIGRVSDSVPNLLARWRAEAAKAASAQDGAEKEAGAAVLEYRLVYRRWPQVGDLIEVRSGVTEVGAKTQRLVHWLLDPASGEAWATAEAVAVTFDLKTRKTIAPPPTHRAALAARIVEGMTI